jgi:NAD(P)-dependent dehydrogenase (short-subunit alcohol dehydrogenase family)
MGLFFIFNCAVVSLAVLLAGFYRYSAFSCRRFEIDDSRAAGLVVVITGANSGLGLQTARALAKAKSHVVMACRREKSCEEAKQSILRNVPDGQITTLTLDLASFASIRNFVDNFRYKFDHLDVLVNNAGIMALTERSVTEVIM